MVVRRASECLEGGDDGSALGVAQHHDQAGAEAIRGELDASDLGRGDDVASDANDEQVAEALVEYQFRRHAGIGTSQDDGKRLLAPGDLVAARLARQRVVASNTRDEACVPRAQAFQGFACRNQVPVILVYAAPDTTRVACSSTATASARPPFHAASAR